MTLTAYRDPKLITNAQICCDWNRAMAAFPLASYLLPVASSLMLANVVVLTQKISPLLSHLVQTSVSVMNNTQLSENVFFIK